MLGGGVPPGTAEQSGFGSQISGVCQAGFHEINWQLIEVDIPNQHHSASIKATSGLDILKEET